MRLLFVTDSIFIDKRYKIFVERKKKLTKSKFYAFFNKSFVYLQQFFLVLTTANIFKSAFLIGKISIIYLKNVLFIFRIIKRYF